MSDRFQVTGSPTQFWVDAGKTATITNIGNSTVYGSPDLPPISTTVAAWSLVAGASRTEDVGTVWVRCATGASSTLTVEPVASGLAVDTGTGIPSAVSGGSGAASAVTFTPTGTIAATDVQAAIAEVAAEAGSAGFGSPNTQTGSYTLVLADAGTVVEINAASAANLTVPPNTSVAFAVGAVVTARQYGAGQVTVVAGSGVTIRSRGGATKTAGQYAEASLVKRATDEWVLTGDVSV